MLFHVGRDEAGPWSVVRVIGEIDLATAPQYRTALYAAAAAAAVAVDLRECDLIDSVGLGITLGGARRVRSTGGVLVVVAGGAVARMFERTRVDEIIQVVGSLGDLPNLEGGASW